MQTQHPPFTANLRLSGAPVHVFINSSGCNDCTEEAFNEQLLAKFPNAYTSLEIDPYPITVYKQGEHFIGWFDCEYEHGYLVPTE